MGAALHINEELAAVFREVGLVLQYQGESWFKVRSYLAFSDTLDALERPVDQLTSAELSITSLSALQAEHQGATLELAALPTRQRKEVRAFLAALTGA